MTMLMDIVLGNKEHKPIAICQKAYFVFVSFEYKNNFKMVKKFSCKPYFYRLIFKKLYISRKIAIP